MFADVIWGRLWILSRSVYQRIKFAFQLTQQLYALLWIIVLIGIILFGEKIVYNLLFLVKRRHFFTLALILMILGLLDWL